MSKNHPQTLEQAEAQIRGGHERSGGGGGGGFFAFLHRGQKSEAEGQYVVATSHMKHAQSEVRETMEEIDRMRNNRWEDGASEWDHNKGKAMALILKGVNALIEATEGKLGQKISVRGLKISASGGDITNALRALDSEVSRMAGDEMGTIVSDMGSNFSRDFFQNNNGSSGKGSSGSTKSEETMYDGPFGSGY